MSRRRLARAKKPSKASKLKRQEVARRVSELFNKKNPDEKRKFVDRTLTVLVNVKKMQKLFGSFAKRGRPSTKDLEIINQMIVVFLYSVKEEFRYHYAAMIYKRLPGVSVPKDLPAKISAVRKLKFIQVGVNPKIYARIYAEWERSKAKSFDEFFGYLLSGVENKTE
ncbi:unnamed protein product [marine sediment metagenome]|uniref:Uncharacterized protein n=1 Tax=marine sediment metagenome TaxID=412755 RepID=X1MWZ2_9ZZZZ